MCVWSWYSQCYVPTSIVIPVNSDLVGTFFVSPNKETSLYIHYKTLRLWNVPIKHENPTCVCTGLGGLWGHKFDMGMTEVLKCEGF